MAQVERATATGGKQYITNVLSEFVFDTNGWQELGWKNLGGMVASLPVTVSVYIPRNIKVTSAIVYVYLGSRYVSGGGLVDGYYCPTNIKLYNGLEGNDVYINYPYSSESVIVTSGGTLNTTFGTWNTTGSATVQVKSVDITKKIVTGNRYEIKLTGGADIPGANAEYYDGGIVNVEVVVTGYVR